jgi:excinuclease ABC subunit C
MNVIEQLREKALGLSALPGVYIMLDKSGGVLYVGKAKHLKNRVSSYFSGAHDVKTEVLVSKIQNFDVIVTNTEFEAFVLENSLIKHHVPRYNIKLRDDKGFPFLRVDLENDYPEFKIVSKPFDDGANYLGPFGGRSVLRKALSAVCTALLLPTCGKNLSKVMGKERPCLNYHMGACRAYCNNSKLKSAHREAIEAAVDIFQGKTSDLTEKLKNEMNDAAESLSFELAAEKRDRLRAITSLEEKQFVVAGAMADVDVVGFFRGAAKSCLTVLHYIDGKLIAKDYEILETPIEDDPDAVVDAIRLYYERRGVLPKSVYIPFEASDAELLEQFFYEKTGRRVKISSPQRGDKAKLVETANINAREEAEIASTYEEKTLKTLQWLQNALKLPKSPDRIEAFDISNTAGVDTVASMTVFVKAKPYKKDYRRFKIKTVTGQDDYASMAEVIKRRIGRLSELILPDLLLVDGGVGHASIAKKITKDAGLEIAVFGMVKDDRHRTKALVSPTGEEIGLSANPAVFSLIGAIQEETHRFAVEYHQSLRSKKSIKSKLDMIDGIGPKRRNELLKKFGSVKSISAANVEDLTQVVPKNVAESIFAYFRKEGGE